jgi:hypothetical protein
MIDVCGHPIPAVNSGVVPPLTHGLLPRLEYRSFHCLSCQANCGTHWKPRPFKARMESQSFSNLPVIHLQRAAG